MFICFPGDQFIPTHNQLLKHLSSFHSIIHYSGSSTGVWAGDSDWEEWLGDGWSAELPAPGVRDNHGHQGWRPASGLLWWHRQQGCDPVGRGPTSSLESQSNLSQLYLVSPADHVLQQIRLSNKYIFMFSFSLWWLSLSCISNVRALHLGLQWDYIVKEKAAGLKKCLCFE